jgi:serine/threonine protein kinase
VWESVNDWCNRREVFLLSVGTTLQQRYRIDVPIGAGGMGQVYRAQDLRLGRLVAIKEFNPFALPPADRMWATQAFEQEARMLAQLSHPGLTAVYDSFTENGLFYLVMEYVQGETLEQIWQRHRRFSEAQTLTWAGQLCEVLAYLHGRTPPIIFRDLKPANIMVQPDGRLKLIDFGIARYFKPGQTRDTIALGTPGYAAPEQHGQQQADARSDVYALGVILHQLLSGYDPALSPFTLPPLRPLAPSVSTRVLKAIDQAVALRPEQRPPSSSAFYALLRPGQQGGNLVWLLPVLSAIFILLLVGIAGGWWISKRIPPQPTLVAGLATTPILSPDLPATTVALTATSLANTPTAVIDPPSATSTYLPSPTSLPISTVEPTVDIGSQVFAALTAAAAANPTATPTPLPAQLVQTWSLTRSAGGRAIHISQIGSGSRHIVLIGGVRGGERPDSGQLVIRLRDHFEANLHLVLC